MINFGKKNVLGIGIDALDYEAAVRRIIDCACQGHCCPTTALAVHGLITGALDPSHRFRLNHFELAVPDGQPIRWALRFLHGVELTDRVYGPKLSLLVCRQAALLGIPVYFYGSRKVVIEKLCARLSAICPGLKIAGAEASAFRTLTSAERSALVNRISDSGAHILFVGLGCPRQEVFAFEMSAHLNMPILAVGAAFDYFSGLLKEPPEIVQRAGLQWLFRMSQEPTRLWKRYIFTNTQFVALLLFQFLHLWKPKLNNATAPSEEVLYG